MKKVKYQKNEPTNHLQRKYVMLLLFKKEHQNMHTY
jgi:hypothetical protein